LFAWRSAQMLRVDQVGLGAIEQTGGQRRKDLARAGLGEDAEKKAVWKLAGEAVRLRFRGFRVRGLKRSRVGAEVGALGIIR